MGNISYTAHVSNKKSAITSKSKLAAVAKHNLRKYKSSDYSKDNICIIYGTSNLIDDVKTVYHKEFDEALEEYNKKHNIVPKTIIKEIRDNISNVDKTNLEKSSKNDIISVESIEDIEKEMKEAAKKLDFERAMELRDILFELKSK